MTNAVIAGSLRVLVCLKADELWQEAEDLLILELVWLFQEFGLSATRGNLYFYQLLCEGAADSQQRAGI